MNLFELNEALLGIFDLPTINEVVADNITILNEKNFDYGIAVLDLANAIVEDDNFIVTYRVYLLDRMQTNTQSPITIWSAALDQVKLVKSRLEEVFFDYSIGQITFLEQTHGDILAGCSFELSITIPIELEC